ncbi:MAG: glycerol-3-phosphate 1-O-acyltransferase PlsY [Bdellovibrionales bacterium]|nr:glycerol-3-phosphate 1-O-acyltransferase PlsY [Bdellovibrionales bacterium]
MAETILTFFSLAPFYLLGAFPTGRLVGKLYGIDVTREGSGNIGATNVARVIGKKAGITTLSIDLAKGFLCCFLGAWLASDESYGAWSGLAGVFGHCFSIPPLKGGKGVATTSGVMLWLSPLSLLLALFVFAGVYSMKRVVSLASVAAALFLPLPSLLNQSNSNIPITLVAACAALIVVFRHKENLKRFSEGREEVFQSKKES